MTKGPHPLLARYLSALASHPLRTKAITTGQGLRCSMYSRHLNSPPALLCFLQEILGSNLAGIPAKKVSKDYPLVYKLLANAHVDAKAIKMAVYGFLVSAPLSHFLVGALQKAFTGRTDTRARVAQIVTSNLLVSPIQASSTVDCRLSSRRIFMTSCPCSLPCFYGYN